MRISNRLSEIQKRISKKNSIICDVGCDHGYTSIYGILNNNVKFAYNIDIAKEPLNKCIENIKKNNILKFTKNIIANGLNTSEITKKINYCVISGLGGKNIANIINNRNKKIKIIRFICVLNNNSNLLRDVIKKNNFKITFEKVICEGNKYYELIEFGKNKGLMVETIDDINYGPYNLKFPSNEFINMLKIQKNKYLKLCNCTSKYLEKVKKINLIINSRNVSF